MPTPSPSYRRVLLKLSGEALQGETHGIDPLMLTAVAEDLQPVTDLGVRIGIVVGGGNIFRGMSTAAQGMSRPLADAMGMLATVINALALQDALRRQGLASVAMSAIAMPAVCEPFSRRRAVELLDAGSIVVMGAGTGNPYFTTDTAACLRALEVGADIVMKATKVDGVYDKDPMTHPEARRFDRLTLDEALERNLKVMDSTALSLCRDNSLPILVFDMLTRGNIQRAVCGEPVGTIVEAGPG